MNLSDEDTLRLNVLLANEVQAIRIDENRNAVYGLTPEGEIKVQLNPNCRAEKYVKQVRAMLSGHVMGSPGGYPVFLRRWTRMGQMRDESLAELLLLGEPEAVVAVAHAAGLSPELARRAWWAMPSADIARRMLENEAVAKDDLAKELADFLIDYLPFETEPRDIIDSVRLVLQPGLIDQEKRRKIWERGQRKNVFYVGFLDAIPNALPAEQQQREDTADYVNQLEELHVKGNPIADRLLAVLSGSGQAFLSTVETVLKKPSHQEVMTLLLEAVGKFLRPAACESLPCDEVTCLEQQAEALCQQCNRQDDREFNQYLADVLAAVPGLRQEVIALLVLARAGETMVSPIFTKTTAIGTVMRKKLEPVSTPLLRQIAVLRGR